MENTKQEALFDDYDGEDFGDDYYPSEEELSEVESEESWFEDETANLDQEKYYDRYNGTVGFKIKVNQNKKPTLEELKAIKKDYDKGVADNNQDLKSKAIVKMMEILDAYVHELIKKNYASYEQKYGEELLQEAYLGIMEGLEKYNPEKGAPTTWFKIYIQHRMNAYLDSQVHHTTPHFVAATAQVQAVIDRKEAEGKPYTILDLHLESGVSIKTIQKCLNTKLANNSLPFESKSSITENLPSSMVTPEEAALRNEQHEMLINLITKLLTNEEKKCALYYYGFITGKPENPEAIAEVTGIQKQYVKRYINSALEKLKNPVKRTYGAKKPAKLKLVTASVGVAKLSREERNQQIAELEESLDEVFVDSV